MDCNLQKKLKRKKSSRPFSRWRLIGLFFIHTMESKNQERFAEKRMSIVDFRGGKTMIYNNYFKESLLFLFLSFFNRIKKLFGFTTQK